MIKSNILHILFYLSINNSCVAKCRTNLDCSSVGLIDLNHNHGANTGIAPNKSTTPSKPSTSTKSPKPPAKPNKTSILDTKLIQPQHKPIRPAIKRPTAKPPVRTPMRPPTKATKSIKSTAKPTVKSPSKTPKSRMTAAQQKTVTAQPKAAPTTLVLIKQETHEENHLFL